jgi:hypothetical protein
MLGNNTKAYKMLVEIEISLREFFISTFNKRFPESDWLNDISGKGPLSRNMIESIKSKKATTIKEWTGGKFIHELYFLDFPDLSQILSKKTNKNFFPDLDHIKIEAISRNIVILFPIRNKIAHSRIINLRELKIVESVHGIIKNSLIDFENLLLRQNHESVVDTILDIIDKVENYLEVEKFDKDCLLKMHDYPIIESLKLDISAFCDFIQSYRVSYSKSQSKISLKKLNRNIINEFKQKIIKHGIIR